LSRRVAAGARLRGRIRSSRCAGRQEGIRLGIKREVQGLKGRMSSMSVEVAKVTLFLAEAYCYQRLSIISVLKANSISA
jgi:hypothetical protein